MERRLLQHFRPGHNHSLPRQAEDGIDLKELIDGLKQRGLDLPILIRFNGILRDRLKTLSQCFQKAIDENGYQNGYRCIYPIKVNQQRDVVQQIIRHGQQFGSGVEAGSKPELLAVVAMTDADTPIICNGFKDAEFIRMALLAQRLGRTVIPVVEKVSELDLILEISEELGVRPTLGMRVKLATRGSGRWQASGGYRSKFGLTVAEMLNQSDRLIDHGMGDCFQLLHFLQGCGRVRQLKAALGRAARIYVDPHRRGAGFSYLDVEEGVDYDGLLPDTASSMNYTMQEYANDVVFHVQTVCDEAAVPHPQLISESGRAIAAHHSVLVVETLGVTSQGNVQAVPMQVPEHYEQPVLDLWNTFCDLSSENIHESYHGTRQNSFYAKSVRSRYSVGLSSTGTTSDSRGPVLFYASRSGDTATQQDPHVDFKELDRMLSDIYFVNFSLFQSIPDSWAINHLFPVVPVHRLDEQPIRR